MNFGPGLDAFTHWLAGDHPGILALVLGIVVVWIFPLLAVVLPVAVVGQIVERKVAAAMQRRVGPNAVGLEGPLRFAFRTLLFFLPRPKQDRAFGAFCRAPGIAWALRVARSLGIGQLVADTVKMIGKEDIVPRGADGVVFRVAPYLAVIGSLLPFCALPFAQYLVMLEIPIGALYAIAISGITVMALLMAGWGSGSKFSLLGGMRAVAQMVSYEIPVGLAVAGVVLWAGSMDLHAIVAQQYRPGVLSFLGWNLLQSPFLFLLACVFFLAGLAECQRTPFDMAEAETELVSGFNTEYSGLRWGMFAMAEYTEMIFIGALFATLFLGGYQSPIGEQWIVGLPVWLESIVHLTILAAKFVLCLFVMVWIRWTLPRFRVDQVMRLCWRTLVPLCLLGLFGIAATMLVVDAVAPGDAHGRLPAMPHVDLGFVGMLLSWAIPLAGFGALTFAAWRKYGQMHPTLRSLTGGRS
ncbi:MAG: complex I subunit 1 family protein [Planctomycetota bacterium]